MSYFKANDGRLWSIRLDDGLADASGFPRRIVWEAVLVETVPPSGTQRVVFRPAGWLLIATADDMARALTEAESVRSRWDSAATPIPRAST